MQEVQTLKSTIKVILQKTLTAINLIVYLQNKLILLSLIGTVQISVPQKEIKLFMTKFSL